MGDLYIHIVQGIVALLSFYLGSWVYYKGQQDQSPNPFVNLDKPEEIEQESWDQV